MQRGVWILVILLAGLPCQGHSQASEIPPLEFSVASIKPSNPAGHDNGYYSMPWGAVSDRFTARNMTIAGLLRAAYGLPLGGENSRIAETPAWTRSDEYDVDAQLDAAAVEALKKLTKDQRVLAQQHMIQVLLADRCKLATHHETRQLPIYTLVIAKSGPKLQIAKDGELFTSSFSGSGRVKSITAQAASMARLVDRMEVALGRPVVDQTGLPGKYDCKVEWMPNDGPPSADPPAEVPSSIFTAMQEQVGLKLVPGKGPVDVIVIDRLEKPAAN